MIMELALGLVLAQQPTPPRKLVEVRICRRVETDQPKATGLSCGWEAEGDILLDIPETEYQFPKGESFRLYIYSDGHNEFPVDHQPEGSRVIKSPPCKKVVREAVPAANSGPCNPALKEN